MSIAFMAIGIPGCGKSTWAGKVEGLPSARMQLLGDPRQSCVVLSTDDIITQIGSEYGFSYNDAFQKLYPFAEKVMYKDLEAAVAVERDIYWDQTNLTAKVRRRKLEMIPAYYMKVAVCFATSLDEAKKRNEKRSAKVIPAHVIDNMWQQLELPTFDEDFDRIINVDNTGCKFQISTRQTK